MITIQDLQFFIKTAKELHFAKAANLLGVPQPTLSRNIKELEKEIGCQLFSRTNKWHVSLTKAGEAFLPEAEKTLRQLQFAIHRAKAAGEGTAGHLSIGAISSALGKSQITKTLTTMKKNYPDVTLEILDSTSTELFNLMKERTLDLAVMRIKPEDVTQNYIIEKIYEDPLMVALPSSHPLVKKAKLYVSDLAKEEFLLVPSRTSDVYLQYICDVCKNKGNFNPKVSESISSSYTALQMTAANLGITMISSTYCGLFPDKITYRSFDDISCHLPVYAVYDKDNTSPILKIFLKLLKQNLMIKDC